ncbi:MAG: hypothetical protein F4Z31_02740 [Gemmatimonadetes bacterium]|nr:hypothetical protein [Gemmatimonadota bacterium]MYE92483.1 hypothetical protein [Gemmatimonadota bacterium]MYJ10915.1 hypothetical protein [Gemmatimonadota bacterium]
MSSELAEKHQGWVLSGTSKAGDYLSKVLVDSVLLHASHGTPESRVALELARDALAGVADQADKEGFPVPTPEQHDQAGALLDSMYRSAALDYSIYATPNAEIAIDYTRRENALVVLCDSDGAVEGIFDTEDEHTQIWSDNPNGTFSAFLDHALSRLRPTPWISFEWRGMGEFVTPSRVVRVTRHERLEIGSGS